MGACLDRWRTVRTRVPIRLPGADEYAESIRVYREMTYQDIGMTYDFFVVRAVELHGA